MTKTKQNKKLPSNNPQFVRAWAILRLLVAGLIVAGTIQQILYTIDTALATHVDPAFSVARFFTFFTIISNTALVVFFTITGIRALVHKEQQEPTWLVISLASVSTYMLITGIVYNTLLAGTGAGWGNIVHHVIAPIFVLIDVLFAPRQRNLSWKAILWCLIYPVVWTALTLATGPFRINTKTGGTAWYPYPFLNPAQPGGYGSVALWVVAISVGVIAIMSLVIFIGRVKNKLALRAVRSA